MHVNYVLLLCADTTAYILDRQIRPRARCHLYLQILILQIFTKAILILYMRFEQLLYISALEAAESIYTLC